MANSDQLEGQETLTGMPDPPVQHPKWIVILKVKAKKIHHGKPKDKEFILEELEEEFGCEMKPEDAKRVHLYDEDVTRTSKKTIRAPHREDALERGKKSIVARVGDPEDLYEKYGPGYITQVEWIVKAG